MLVDPFVLRPPDCLPSIHMPKGRFSQRQKVAKRDAILSSRHRDISCRGFEVLEDVSQDVSTIHSSPYLITLLFETRQTQHAALARIEAFYESSSASSGEFIDMERAKAMKLCPNYEAFNFPIKSVKEWLLQMQIFYNLDKQNDQGSTDENWWKPFCNEEEAHLLSYLVERNCIETLASESDGRTPTYLVSSLRSEKEKSLPHEQLHFLFYMFPAYRKEVEAQYHMLLPKTRNIIENDLAMRGYASHVWVDEFQAYTSLNAGEFGNKPREECTQIRQQLVATQRKLWKELSDFPICII